MSGDHNQYQKPYSYLDFECPRCGHCCQQEHMTKLEAWKAWCESTGTPDLATEFTLEQSSHGKAFSFAWESGFIDGMQHQMKSSVEKALEKEQESIRLQCTTCGTVYADGLPPQVAQPEEEPVAWRSTSPDGKLANKFVGTSVEVNWTPIYTDPPKREWAGLTEREVEECTIAAERDYERYMHATRGQQLGQRDQLDWWIARAIETKLKEKNT